MRRNLLSISAIALLSTQMVALAQPAPGSEIAPTGKLRSAVIGIRVLGGVGEPIGRFVAEKLGVSFEPVAYPSPQAYEQSFGKGEWDIAIGPRVLAPADKADVGPDLWLIDLLYLAAAGERFASADQVDRPGVKVGTIENSPSDRFLTRTLKSSQSDILRMYSRSNSIHSSKPTVERPLICQRQVRPGFIARRRRRRVCSRFWTD